MTFREPITIATGRLLMCERAPVIDVSSWPVEDDDPDEPLGARGSIWLVAPADGYDVRQWIFKPVRTRTVRNSGELAWFEEDWAEHVGTSMGEFLGLPVARIELAIRDGHRGVISPSFVHDRKYPPTFGNELLFQADPEYPLEAKGEVSGYTPIRCLALLAGCHAPLGAHPVFTSAVDAFAGYLLLDALVANTDRHHENWSVLQHQGNPHLAPCYDFGTCLGFQLTDRERQERLTTTDVNRTVAAWCERGFSRTFERRPLLVEVAREAMGISADTARTALVKRLNALDDGVIAAVIDAVPADRMSRPAGTFAAQVLRINRDRLLESLG